MIYGSPSEDVRTTATPGARLRIEDIIELAEDTREGRTFTVFLLKRSAYYIGIVRPNDTLFWVGVASFPLALAEVAYSWFDSVQTDTDIENLLREWGSEMLRDEFEQFVVHG